MPTIIERLQHGWNAFLGRDPTRIGYQDYGMSYSYRPDRLRFTRGNERSIISCIYNRIAMDVASIDIEHVRLDDDGRYAETLKSGLNNVLTVEANIDQTGRALIQDICMSMFDEGVVAVVPVDTSIDPTKSGSYEIETMRTGEILEWYPAHVKVRLYNDKTGQKEDIVLPKKMVAIIENPLYAIMNEPNSTLQRLIRTINKLDYVNDQSTSGKLDLIVQLPGVVKTDVRREYAERRRNDIETQLSGSKYGIAYIDSTERVTQLNRSLENNLWVQVKDLSSMLYNQLGLTENVLNGTADEKEMNNYYSRTIEPLVASITEEMTRKFLTKKARTQHQAIRFFRDPFSLTPVSDIAEIADKFTRNEIASSNEIRAILGWKPSQDPRADELRNSNLYQNEMEVEEDEEIGEEIQNGENSEETPEGSPDESDFDDVDSQIDELEALLSDDEDSSEIGDIDAELEDLIKSLGRK